MRIRSADVRGIVIVMLISLCPCVAAASEPGTNAHTPMDVLDEALITGKRLPELRAAVIAAEDRMLARYNELNQDDDLDIECFEYTRTGTRISYRYCQLKLQARAQRKDSSEFLQFMRAADTPNGGASPMPEVGIWLAGIWLAERSEDYRKNLVKLLQDDPGLRELVVQRAEALRRYEAERRSVKGGSPVKK